MKEIFQRVCRQTQHFDAALYQFVGGEVLAVITCAESGHACMPQHLKVNGEDRVVISCMGYPECRRSIWLPNDIVSRLKSALAVRLP